MRRNNRQACVLLAIILALGACADRGTLAVLDVTEDPAGEPETLHQIYVVTNRKRKADALDFSGDRSTKTSYARYVMSIPPTHKSGKVEWPSGKPDPKTDIVAIEAMGIDDTAQMKTILNNRIAQLPVGQREAKVFVHGYNTNFAEGLYRFTQISHDMGGSGIPVLFSWPSAGETNGYVYDRDSTTIARDRLESFLTDLAASNIDRIFLIGHSMGGFLTVETLRQMAIAQRPAFRKKLGGVVLISPDIDLEVFKEQISRIKPVPKPFVIIGSTQDKALGFSAKLTGKSNRLGSAVDSKQFRALGVTLIDVSDYKGGDALKHSTAFTSPAVIALLRGISKRAQQQLRSGAERIDLKQLWDAQQKGYNQSTQSRIQ
ncbi:MAG: alpha/beta fold hydrolase [Hyphomicrobiales bacterium]|nr:alpha/beta fold hydrolase [Hyphomicrobiales bacterium]